MKFENFIFPPSPLKEGEEKLRIVVKSDGNFYDVKSITPDGIVSAYGINKSFAREEVTLLRNSLKEAGEDVLVNNDPGPDPIE